MKKAIIIAGLTAALFNGQATATTNNQLFNVRINFTLAPTMAIGIPLLISTNIPGHTYQTAGIKINTAGYTLARPGVDCQPTSNGYCLFSVSDTSPATIQVIPPIGLNPSIPNLSFNLNLCLNGTGNTFSCENHIVNSTLPD